MIDLLKAYEVFKGAPGEEGARGLTDLLAEMREEMIKTIVSEELFAEAQRRTEERMDQRNGVDVLVLGECKVRASKKEVRDFLRLADRIEKLEGVETFRLFVCYDYTPEVEELLKELGVSYHWSYELEG